MVTFFNEDGTKSFSLMLYLDKEWSDGDIKKNKIWIKTEDGEGGTFDADEISDVIYNAIKAYYDKKL
jgi:hypothetical protein